jgi:protein-S-isoprenylcysteine O-methyltransferase Ste14
VTNVAELVLLVAAAVTAGWMDHQENPMTDRRPTAAMLQLVVDNTPTGAAVRWHLQVLKQPCHDQAMDRPRVPRGVAFAFVVSALFGIYGFVPWLIGRRGAKVGWRNGRPSALNRAGLIPLGLGAAGLAWNMAVRFAAGETTVPVSLVPENLISTGPHRFSRNPMYVCEQALLLGWTVYFGSPGLLFGASAHGAGMQYAVRREERTLEERFGDSWREYASRVPRWI